MATEFNSFPLEVVYEIFGWIAFFSWSISFYPQVFLNFRRKSVVGLNFDFVLLNLTNIAHISYTTLHFNLVLMFRGSTATSMAMMRLSFGLIDGIFCSLNHMICKFMIPVAANDVAFFMHAVILTAFTLFQIFIYERGNQKVSKISFALVFVAWCAAAICVFIALPSHSWLWLITIFNTIQVSMTVIKYIPQAFMNFYWKSTEGFSIGNILLDFLGGVTNYAQMATQSIDQGSWVNFYGNIGKTLLSLVSIFFDLLFMVQHYVLYLGKPIHYEDDETNNDALLKTSDSDLQ